MLASNQLDLTPLSVRVAPLEDWKSWFDAMHSGEIVKGVLHP
jgi:threonine dehydrogenase-like Zn-dependent dehydrogenase